MELGGITFEWIPSKAEKNLRKHGFSFDEAASVFFDPLARTGPDTDHSDGELRFLIIGHSSSGNFLLVSHTERGDSIHIISARRATPRESRDYEYT